MDGREPFRVQHYGLTQFRGDFLEIVALRAHRLSRLNKLYFYPEPPLSKESVQSGH